MWAWMAAQDGVSVRSFCRRYAYARSTFYYRLGRVAAFLNAERARNLGDVETVCSAGKVKEYRGKLVGLDE